MKRERDQRGAIIGLLGVLASVVPAAAQNPPSTPAGAPPPPSGQPAVPAPAAGTPTTEPAGEPTVLTLDQAVQLAIRENPTLDQAEAAVRRAEGVVAEARALQRPRLDGNAQFTLQGPIPSFVFTQPAEQPGQPARRQEIAFGRTFTKVFNIAGTYDVDLFGRRRDTRRAAERTLDATRGGLSVTHNELVFAVQNLYLAALRTQELIGVFQETLASAAEQLRVAEAGFRAGTAAEFDVVRGRVQVANVRQDLVTAQANSRRALATLAQVVSLDSNSRIDLVPVALPAEPAPLPGLPTTPVPAPTPPATPETPPVPAESVIAPAQPMPDSLRQALEEAFNRRPELYRAIQNERAAQARVAFERKGNLPNLAFSAGFTYAPDQAGLAVQTKTWSLVANLAVPIWDGGVARARTRQARADVDSARAELESARDAVTEEVKRALLDLEDAAERRRSASANTVQAREALRIASVRYNAGLAPPVEIIDAEAALAQARTNEVNAAYDYVAALANLNRSLGRYSPPATAPARTGAQGPARAGAPAGGAENRPGR